MSGPSAFRIRSMTQFSGTPPLPVRRGRPVRPTIDLTTPSKASLGDDCVVLPDKPLFDKAQVINFKVWNLLILRCTSIYYLMFITGY